jgi:hypothetical protein
VQRSAAAYLGVLRRADRREPAEHRLPGRSQQRWSPDCASRTNVLFTANSHGISAVSGTIFQLLRIEQELGAQAKYAGRAALKALA